MARPLSRFVKSEGRLRTLLGIAALLLVPPLLMLLVIATKFGGLQYPAAMDHAQLARNIAASDGYTTAMIRPLSLAVKPVLDHHPDLVNAPLHPLVLAFFLQLSHAGDRVVAAVGALLWILSVWLTFLVGWRWFSGRAAAVGACFWGVNVAGVAASVEGLPSPLMAVNVLLALALALPRSDEPEQPAVADLPPWRAVLAGVACGGAFLTHPALLVVGVVLGTALVVTAKRQTRQFVQFGVGFLLPVLPWCVHNYRAGGRLLGLVAYDLLTGTASFPGDSVWRTGTVPQSPILFMVEHPLQIARKLAFGLGMFRSETFRMLDPVVLFLFVAAMFVTVATSHRRRASRLVGATLLAGIVASCLLRPEPGVLLAWGPLVGILGAARLEDWIVQHVGRPEAETLPSSAAETAAGRRKFRRRGGGVFFNAAAWKRLAMRAGVVAVAAFPLLGFVFVSRPGWGGGTQNWAGPVGEFLPAQAVVMTDQPAAVAWYAQRPAVLLFQHEKEFIRFARVVTPVDAILVTAGIAQLNPEERADWWRWIAAPRGIYRGLALAARMPPNVLLRVATKDAGTLPPDLEQLRQEAEQEQNPAPALVRLANGFLQHDRLREAADAFQRALRADAQNPDAVLGLWQIQAQLQDTSGTLALVQRALQINSQTPNATAVLEEAARLLDQALWARPQEPWILLSAAVCQAKLKHWTEAESYARRAAAAVPYALPPRLVLGDLYLEQELIDAASAEFERLAAAQPDNALVHDALGRTRKAQGRWADALTEFAAAARLRPNWVAPYLSAGDTYQRLQQPEEAVQSFTKARQVAPRSLPATVGLIQALIAAGHIDRAIEACEKSLTEFPGHPVLSNNLAFLYAQQGAQLDRAAQIIRPLVQSYPTNPTILDTAGWIDVRAGRYADAIAPLSQAIDLAPNNALAQYHLGKALLGVGRAHEAAQSFRRALTLGLPATEARDAGAALAGR